MTGGIIAVPARNSSEFNSPTHSANHATGALRSGEGKRAYRQ
jgi:hypothetical protein